ncbi:MAG: SulP family inorganic anion transporter [Humidesulfovibrio sp.]|nr:SulP family inorganic anion transporter [Humidesulfovibrio sp.]
MPSTYVRDMLRDATTPNRLVPALSSGFVVGLLIIVVQLSLATLIFSGPLAPFAPRAAGLTLFGGCVMCLVVALGSSFPTSICLPEDSPAAILATVAAGIAATLAADTDPRATFVTVGAAMALSTLGTGALFLVLGRFRLGNLMRYMPYPVVGGFLAGVGWLLIQGSFAIMTGTALGFSGLRVLLSMHDILRWAPGVALGLILFLSMQRWQSVFILPGALALALGGFALYLFSTGQSLADAGQSGLLLGGIPNGSKLWPVFTLADVALIRWDALAEQIPQLLTIPLVSAISFLLVCSGIEAAAHQDLDLNHELYLNATANFLAGPGGSHAGYSALSFSMLGPTMGSDSRLVGITAALLTGGATFFGAALLGSFPRFILGGLVFFLGFSTVLSWAVDARKRVTRVEYALILAILCAIALFGFLSGVGFGLIMATVVFVIKYSRLPVVRQDTDATALSSTRHRSVPDRHILREQGRGVRILRVMGYLFFGSANILSRAVAEHLDPEAGPPPSHLILDFAEADGFDSSAVNCFLRMLQRCAAVDCQVVFAAAPPTLEEQMRRASPQEVDAARFLPDLDRALEWCEDAILARELARLETHADASGRDKLFDLAVDDLLLRLEEGERFEALVERLGPYLEHHRVAAGETILRQGDTPDGVWLFVSGQAEEVLRNAKENPTRLRTLGPGSAVGQTAPQRGGSAPGGVIALTDCVLAFLPAASLRNLESADPAMALEFYSLFTMLLESRLAEVARAQK